MKPTVRSMHDYISVNFGQGQVFTVNRSGAKGTNIPEDVFSRLDDFVQAEVKRPGHGLDRGRELQALRTLGLYPRRSRQNSVLPLDEEKRHHYQERKMSGETKRIVLATYSSHPDSSDDCDYAVVGLTPYLVQSIRSRLELARLAGRQDEDLCELCFRGCTAEFHDSRLVDTCKEALASDQAAQDWLAELEQDGHALVPAAADLKVCEPQRVERDQMVVWCGPSDDPECAVAWTATPKDSDLYVTTYQLQLAALEGYVRGEPTG